MNLTKEGLLFALNVAGSVFGTAVILIPFCYKLFRKLEEIVDATKAHGESIATHEERLDNHENRIIVVETKTG